MQQRLTFSLHGVIALVLTALVFASEYIKQLNTTWVVVGPAVFLYGLAVLWISTRRMATQQATQRYITMRSRTEFTLFQLLIGCHIAYFIFLISLWFIFQEYILGIFLYAAVPGGLLIPFLLFQRGKAGNYIGINLHGLVSFILICGMFLAAFVISWDVVWWYFATAIGTYALVVALKTNLQDASNSPLDLTSLRVLLGCHLAFVFLLVGVLLDFKDKGIYLEYLLASVGGGIAIPFLLLRTKP